MISLMKFNWSYSLSSQCWEKMHLYKEGPFLWACGVKQKRPWKGTRWWMLSWMLSFPIGCTGLGHCRCFSTIPSTLPHLCHSGRDVKPHLWGERTLIQLSYILWGTAIWLPFKEPQLLLLWKRSSKKSSFSLSLRGSCPSDDREGIRLKAWTRG